MEILSLFENLEIDADLHRMIIDKSDPETIYIIAITPRSGSSYLSSIMRNSKLMGSPSELLPPAFMKNILKRIPAKNPDEYLRNVLKKTQTNNKVAGLKASWFQFKRFINTLEDRSVLTKFKYIYLYRRDVVQQAVSLYKATESNLFHTNIDHSEDTIEKAKNLEYSYEKIKKWKERIERGEREWLNFFRDNKIHPLTITYEQVDFDVSDCMRSIAEYLNVESKSRFEVPAIFKKLRDRQSLEYACQFSLDFYDELKQKEVHSDSL